jgi:hypothetical protein
MAIITFFCNFIFLWFFRLKSKPKSKLSGQVSVSILAKIGVLLINIAIAHFQGATACLLPFREEIRYTNS